MESKEKMIEIIAMGANQYYETAKDDVNSVIGIGISSNVAAQALKELSDGIRNIKNSFPPKRGKPTNYTKPRNRKKKNKY
ncbi:hypothetical protein [uncultured Chryseobacterium sp.]|uniref:hypothetical protein n=1 Tax=uncultured Chryseobacterium sp. TaxID=259322 RepID=UPI0025885689|nr:hypothetical protein [uncultured Chryseobacterium sp.]